jgi:hypothetical protein
MAYRFDNGLLIGSKRGPAGTVKRAVQHTEAVAGIEEDVISKKLALHSRDDVKKPTGVQSRRLPAFHPGKRAIQAAAS